MTSKTPKKSDTRVSSGGIVDNYARLVDIGIDLNLGVGFQPPNEQQVIDGVFDANNSTMLSTGLMTPDELVATKAIANAFFLADFAVDFANGTPLPNYPGGFTADGFDMYPYGTAAAPINVVVDSDNLGRGATGTWSAFQFGWACPALADGTFQGGLYAGNTYKKGDVISYFIWVFAKTNGAPLAPQFIKGSESIPCRSPWVSKNILDQQGFTNTLSPCECHDENGVLGFYMETYQYHKDPTTLEVTFRFKAQFTWPNPGQPIPKADSETVVKFLARCGFH